MASSATFRFFLAVTVLAAGPGAGCGGDDFPPPPEVCGDPGTATAAALAAGRPGDGPFVPYQAGERADIRIGSGAVPLLGVRLRVTAGAELSCLGYTLELRDRNGALAAFDDTPAPTYDLGDGTRATHDLWIPVTSPPDPGDPARLLVVAAGRTVDLELVTP